MPEQPHLRMPFNFGPAGEPPLVTEQEDENEIEDCVENLLRYTIGFRDDLPGFGIPDLTFSNGPLPLGEISAAILEYEPRAAYLVQGDTSRLEEMIETIRVEIGQGINNA